MAVPGIAPGTEPTVPRAADSHPQLIGRAGSVVPDPVVLTPVDDSPPALGGPASARRLVVLLGDVGAAMIAGGLVLAYVQLQNPLSREACGSPTGWARSTPG